MDISFPILDGGAQDPDVLAEHLSRLNERGNSGHYPIGANNFWHGGVHFETDEPVRAIGDGVVVAYRFNKHALPCEIRTTNVVKKKHGRYVLIDRGALDGSHFRVESDFTKESDEPREHYSNGFVLTKHAYVTPRGGRIVFYALYMHLLPFDDYDASHAPSIFQRDAYFVHTDVDGGGVGVFEDGGVVPTRILPVGAEFEVAPAIATPAQPGTPDWRELDVFDGPGQVRVDGRHLHQISATRYRVTRVVDKPVKADMGLAMHATSDPNSMVLGVIKKGQPLHFKGGQLTGAMSELEGGGWVRSIVNQTIKSKKSRLWPEKFDAVVHPEKPIHVSRGDILGYAGPYRVVPNLLHFEIILESVSFLDNPAGDTWGPQIYRIPKGHAFHTKVATAVPTSQVNLQAGDHVRIFQWHPDSAYVQIGRNATSPRGWARHADLRIVHAPPPNQNKFHFEIIAATATLPSRSPYEAFDLTGAAQPNKREIVAYACDEWEDRAAGARWLKFAYDGTEGWTRAKDVGPFGRTAYDWAHAGWKKVEDSKFSEDGFCDAPDLFEALHEDVRAIIPQERLQHALGIPEVAEKIRRFVCKHPVEWAPAGKKYERLLTGRWFMPKALYDQTMEHHKKLEFWNEISNLTPRASGAWHVHPIEFLRYLKALPGITGEQLCASMYRCGVGKTVGFADRQPGQSGYYYTPRARLALPASMSREDVVKAYLDRLKGFVTDLNEALQQHHIMGASHLVTRRRQAHFIAQTAHECFRYLEMKEGNGPNQRYDPFYGRGALQLTWPSAYHAWFDANRAEFTAEEQGILDDLSPTVIAAETDGPGVHQNLANALATVYTPARRARLLQILDARFTSPAIAIRSSGAWWETHHANGGANEDDVAATTYIINRGDNGLDDRIHCVDAVKSVLSGVSYPP